MHESTCRIKVLVQAANQVHPRRVCLRYSRCRGPTLEFLEISVDVGPIPERDGVSNKYKVPAQEGDWLLGLWEAPALIKLCDSSRVVRWAFSARSHKAKRWAVPSISVSG
jgi:hypothetical protein